MNKFLAETQINIYQMDKKIAEQGLFSLEVA